MKMSNLQKWNLSFVLLAISGLMMAHKDMVTQPDKKHASTRQNKDTHENTNDVPGLTIHSRRMLNLSTRSAYAKTREHRHKM